jgi:hypothetical protein
LVLHQIGGFKIQTQAFGLIDIYCSFAVELLEFCLDIVAAHRYSFVKFRTVIGILLRPEMPKLFHDLLTKREIAIEAYATPKNITKAAIEYGVDSKSIRHWNDTLQSNLYYGKLTRLAMTNRSSEGRTGS